jgi:hypothetical protein
VLDVSWHVLHELGKISRYTYTYSLDVEMQHSDLYHSVKDFEQLCTGKSRERVWNVLPRAH